MTEELAHHRWRPDGKFFRAGEYRVWIKAVTYGPFPGGWPADFSEDFTRMTRAGFNAIRLFETPDRALLDAAESHGLRVFAGLKWGQNADFLRDPGQFSAARVRLAEALRGIGSHPALAGFYVGNEVPADLARWMGPAKVREAIEDLIGLGKELAPQLMFAYASFPSTEYLEPVNADFTAFNVYLEGREAFRKYLKRLHHIAGDRPLVISEFGLDSRRNGLERQAETLKWALQTSHEEETAGMTLYSWSDRWWNAGAEVMDWDFGLVDRSGNPKPALAAVGPAPLYQPNDSPISISVIVCTRNGRERLGNCLAAIGNMTGDGFEAIVVDDGSEDGSADFVAATFPWVRLLRVPPGGLSAARNAGASIAKGDVLAFTDDDCAPDREWISRLRPMFEDGKFAAAGGPNLPPPPRSWEEAVVCASPGAPSHVMLDDVEAEHLPGCNLAVTKAAFDAIGGFDPGFHTAGDDVDFCWRLRAAGYRLGFAPGAFVWHWRRPTIREFLRQQIGYGEAERVLIAKYPGKFSKRGGAHWEGFVYGGGPVRATNGSIIYHGPMGEAGYQSVINRMLPLRGLDREFDDAKSRAALRAVIFLQPRVRAWARNRSFCVGFAPPPVNESSADFTELEIAGMNGKCREDLLENLVRGGWTSAGPTDGWDAEKNDARVLLAIEKGDAGSNRLLVRIWGDPMALPPELQRRSQ